MGLDLRIPIGFLLGTIGFLLVVFGLVSDPSLYQRSLGININLIWGSVLLLFGIGMVVAAKRAAGSRS